MFKTISRLLFGEEEETPEDVKSGEALEEEWLVISHQGQSRSMLYIYLQYTMLKMQIFLTRKQTGSVVETVIRIL